MTVRPTLSAVDIAALLGLPRPTPQQQAVIEHPPAPALVIAGAGSGKTETIAARVVWLVANGVVETDQVLGLTFTRKAAAELSSRVGTRLAALRSADALPGGGEPGEAMDLAPTISTYHAYAGRLVGEHALRIGREPDARLLSEASAWQLAHEVVSGFDGPLEELNKVEATVTAAVVQLAGELAEHLVAPADLERWLDTAVERLDRIEAAGPSLPAGSRQLRDSLRARRALVPVLESFAARKRLAGAIDFADQMALAAQIALRHPAVGALERARFGAVFLDEFQDTSHAQLELLRALFAPDGAPFPVTAVGDPHQSIYAWRGASASTLAAFPRAFHADPDSVLPLATTWRNDHLVLEAANAVSAPLREGSLVPVAALGPAPAAGTGTVSLARLGSLEEEAATVVEWIEQRRASGTLSCAVLCRKRSQFAPVLAALEAAGVPHEVVGIGGLLLTPEVQDIVALLSIAHDAGRGDRLMRLLTGPLVNLGAADLDAFHRWARDHQRVGPRHGPQARAADLSDDAADRVSLVEAMSEFAALDQSERAAAGLSDLAQTRLVDLAARLARLRALAGVGLAELVGEAERLLGLDIEVLARPGHSPAAARAHLDAFADVAARFSAAGDRPTIGGFLAWLDAAIDEERGLDLGTIDVAPGAVHVMTVHAAKGLEWDAVAVPGLVEAVFPAHSVSTTRYDPVGERWSVSEPKDSAWTTALGALPYDLRGDAAALPGLDWRSAAEAGVLEERRETFRKEAGAAGVEEERRLAYVAFTRARHHLLLTAHVWGTQKSPRLPSRFLTQVRDLLGSRAATLTWAEDPGPEEENPRLATPVTALWPAPRTRDGLSPPQCEPQQRDRDEREGSPGDHGGRDRHEPQQRDRDERESSPGDHGGRDRDGRESDWLGRAAQEVRSAQRALAQRRTGTHAEPGGAHVPALPPFPVEIEVLLAERAAGRSGAFDPAGPDAAARAVGALGGHLSASQLVEFAADPQAFPTRVRRPMPAEPAPAARRGSAFHAWVERHYRRSSLLEPEDLPGNADPNHVEHAGLSDLIERFRASPWAARQPDEVEVPVEMVVRGIALRGRIDAVFAKPDGGVLIVDWKTGSAPRTGDSPAAEGEIAPHVLQLAVYREAYARLRGLDPQEVDAAFYYAGSGQSVYPDLPDGERLARLIGELAGV